MRGIVGNKLDENMNLSKIPIWQKDGKKYNRFTTFLSYLKFFILIYIIFSFRYFDVGSFQ